MAYYYGIKPTEFDEMTPRQIGEYVEAAGRREEQRFAERAMLLDGLHQQIISVMASKRPKVLKLAELYPKIFGKEHWEARLTPEQRREVEILRWEEFLGI